MKKTVCSRNILFYIRMYLSGTPIRLLLLLPALTACEGAFQQIKTVDIDAGPPQLVLLSDFENIYTPKVLLSLSGDRQLYNWGGGSVNLYPQAPPATVEVFEDGRSLGMMERDTGSIFSFPSSYLPLAGKTYRLEVKAEGFETVSAEGRIPEPVAIQAEFTGSYKVYQRWGTERKVAEVRLTLHDTPGQSNFYGLVIQSSAEDMSGESLENFGHYVYSGDLLFEDGRGGFGLDAEENNQRQIGYRKNLFTDQTFEGKKKEFLVYVEIDNAREINLQNIYFKLQNLSEDRYKYQITRERARNNEENPFVQPILIHNNVRGGLGIFGTFSTTCDSLKINFNPD